jgi:hypothetical protein
VFDSPEGRLLWLYCGWRGESFLLILVIVSLFYLLFRFLSLFPFSFSFQVQYHQLGEIMVFDDSKNHRAFNHSENEDRIVLIVDLMRPKGSPLGTATGDHTAELDNFVALFK